jgi:hypothetical protein
MTKYGKRKDPNERFDAMCEPGENGCVIFRGCPAGRYGYFTIDAFTQRSGHAFAWERVNGPVPPGYEVHHRCGVKRCVNVEHLELMLTSDHRGHHMRERWARLRELESKA